MTDSLPPRTPLTRTPIAQTPPPAVVMPPRAVPVWMVLLGVFVGVNVIGGMMYLLLGRGDRAPAAPAPEPTAQVAPARELNGLAVAERVAGLQALEANAFAEAAAKFQRAIEIGNGPTDLPELLRIAKELEAKARPSEVVPPAPEEEEPARSKPDDRRSRPKPRAAQKAPAQSPPPPPAATTGRILVTTSPQGLMIAVDGKVRELTPASLELPVGSHTVELRKGDRSLYQTTVDVPAGGVRSVDRDFPELRAPADEARPKPAPIKEDPPPPPAKEVVKEPARTSEAPPPATTADASGGTGEILVESPALLGEVWVNGRKIGYPPVVVRDVPSGGATVEIRVGGAVKKSKTVQVGKNTRIKAVM